jgi:hypothetical protein
VVSKVCGSAGRESEERRLFASGPSSDSEPFADPSNQQYKLYVLTF